MNPAKFTPMDKCVASAAYHGNTDTKAFRNEICREYGLTGKQARKAAKSARRVVRNAKSVISSVSKS